MKKCADWCGGGCTQEQYAQAVQAADKLVQQLGEGWRPEVYENLGWHFGAASPCDRVRVSVRKGDNYLALIGEAGSHAGQWAGVGDTAKAAVGAVLARTKAERDKLTAWLEDFDARRR
jgi:hypothetical protein